MFRRCDFIAGSIVFGLMLAGSAAAEPLRVGASTWVGWGPLFIAKEKGFFNEDGVDVELIKPGEQECFTQLAAGTIDVCGTSVDAMLNHLSKEQGYRYLFAVDDSRGGDGIVADKDITTTP
jgi:NitT/TauT family transport system substrate-binding protein